MDAASILMTFTSPLHVSNGWQSMLWLLPLTTAISIIYKATKVKKIEPLPFIKECVLLLGSILVFMLIAALVLHAIAWLVLE